MALGVALLAIAGVVVVLASRRRKRLRYVQWYAWSDNTTAEHATVTLLSVGQRDTFRIRVYGAGCDLKVTTMSSDGIASTLPKDFRLPSMRPGAQLHLDVRPHQARPEVVVEWWDWQVSDSRRRSRAPREIRFELSTLSDRPRPA